MATFHVTLTDQTISEIDGDAYQQEGPLTTFFRLEPGRQVIDSWSVRLASFRTVDILAIRRHGHTGGAMTAGHTTERPDLVAA